MADRENTPIKVTGSGRPLLKDLHDHVVNNVADKWRDLGVQLLRPDQENKLNIIAADHPHDVVSCCKCVLEKWLDTTTDATWNGLIRALRSPSVQLDYLAGQLEQMLSTAKCIMSKDTKPACEELTSIEDIEVQFAIMTSNIKEALINNNVDVALLIERLCAISAVKDKKVPLFDKDVFEKIKSIDEFWKQLRDQWNILDYELLQYIVNISECREAKDILKEFFSRIDPSAIEDVGLVLDCRKESRKGLLKPMLRIKVNCQKCTPDIKKQVEETVSKIYDLDKYVLRLRSIKKGCIELLYYISKPLKSYVLNFKISQRILTDFLARKIISLHIDKYKLDITNGAFMWYVQQDHEDVTMLVQKEKNKNQKQAKIGKIQGRNWIRQQKKTVSFMHRMHLSPSRTHSRIGKRKLKIIKKLMKNKQEFRMTKALKITEFIVKV